MKRILTTYSPPHGHWVGDGFPVRSLLSYSRMGAANVSPFLLLDYAGPAVFPPAPYKRGVGQHPHRGFETVTLVYQGELEHRDTSGGGGIIGEGDVQWMTAGAGIVHEEFHSPRFTAQGGGLEMVQLWVNLPARDKGTAPRYQTLSREAIPSVQLSAGAGTLRVVAGQYDGVEGPAQTFTPINLWDMHLKPGATLALTVPEGHNTLVIVLKGTLQLNESDVLRDAELARLDPAGRDLRLETNNDTHLLIMTGEPINEPVVGHGPFVMNTQDEIQQAISDFQEGKFGMLRQEQQPR